MSKKPTKVLCFDNYPEAKLALGKVSFPVVIKPYECDDPNYHYTVNDYGEATQMLYDAFEHSKNNWVIIESYII
jgi:hypothetical protein